MMYSLKIVDDFREMRVALGWSVRKAARVIGCDDGDLSRVENHKRKASPAMIQKMVVELNQQDIQRIYQHEKQVAT